MAQSLMLQNGTILFQKIKNESDNYAVRLRAGAVVVVVAVTSVVSIGVQVAVVVAAVVGVVVAIVVAVAVAIEIEVILVMNQTIMP